MPTYGANRGRVSSPSIMPQKNIKIKPIFFEHGTNISYTEISFYLFVLFKHVQAGEHSKAEQMKIVCDCVRVL